MQNTGAAKARLRAAIIGNACLTTDDAGDYLIAASVGSVFLARARDGVPTLLIPLASVASAVGRRGGGFALHPLARVLFEHSGRRWEQPAAILECTDSHLLETFLVLVLDIGERLGPSSGKITWETVVALVEEWQMLLARRNVLTVEQQLGLWGELWVISQAANADVLAAGWRGPEHDATDFFLDGVAVEVKVSRQAHVHHVSQRQVTRPVGRHRAYLLSLWVGIDPVRGIALAELVEAIVAEVSDSPALLKKIAQVGYSPLDSDRYATRFVLLESPLWFPAEVVPRVRDVDPGISNIRYIVSLDVDRAITAETADHLWHHFCQAQPSMPCQLNSR